MVLTPHKIRGTFISFILVSILSSTLTFAGTKVVAIEGANFKVNNSMTNNLRSFSGKRITVVLNSGNKLSGFVKKVGDNLLHLEKLENKDQFDALIKINNISAISTRFRKFQR